MKKIFGSFVLLMLALFFVVDPDWGNSALASPESSGPEALSGRCLEPENPYERGSSHDAGFRWAKENRDRDCVERSEPFYAGCLEFRRRLHLYERCSGSNQL